MIKNIVLTIIFYVADVLVYGSLLGIIYVLGYGLENIFNGGDNNLYHGYLKGLCFYWLIDTILSKFRETYREVTKWVQYQYFKCQKLNTKA